MGGEDLAIPLCGVLRAAIRMMDATRRRFSALDSGVQRGVGTLCDARTREILIEGAILDLPEIGVALPLAELSVGIVFEAEADVDQALEGELT